MKIISKPRGMGKTSHLAKLSMIHHIPVIEPTMQKKDVLKEKFPNAIFLAYDEYCNILEKPKRNFKYDAL